MNYLQLLELIAPEAVVVVTALVVLSIGLMAGRKAAGARISSTQSGLSRSSPANSPADGASALVAALGLAVAVGAVLRLPGHALLFGGMVVISPLNSLFKLVILVLAFFTIVIARGDRAVPHKAEYVAIILLATVGLMLLVGSEELLMIFIGLELTGLSLYILTAFEKARQDSAEAGLKYFLFGSTASAFTLFGLSLIYGMAGTTGLAPIGARLTNLPVEPLLLAGIVMTLVGFAFKIAAAPFHLWAPDAYQGAPISSAAFIASGSKVASFVVLGKILLTGFGGLHGSVLWNGTIGGWTYIIAALAALSILIGNFAALAQKNVRRLLAYSAVAHAGYSLLGLIAGGRNGFSATLFYVTVYAVTLLGAFAIVGFVRRETGGDALSDFAGLSSRAPLLSTCMAVFLLSLAGLPPFAGFFGKFYLFSAAINAAPNHRLLWLVALALFGSLISLYYYLIVLKAIFIEQTKTMHRALPGEVLSRLTIAILAAAVLFFGILPASLLGRILASF